MKRYITWDDVAEYVDKVVGKYRSSGACGVYGLPRGGLALAVMISHRLNIPLLMAPASGCIIIDDICDSGETLIHYHKNSSALEKPKYHITTMLYKQDAAVMPEYYWDVKRDGEWIVFPWEDDECIE